MYKAYTPNKMSTEKPKRKRTLTLIQSFHRAFQSYCRLHNCPADFRATEELQEFNASLSNAMETLETQSNTIAHLRKENEIMRLDVISHPDALVARLDQLVKEHCKTAGRQELIKATQACPPRIQPLPLAQLPPVQPLTIAQVPSSQPLMIAQTPSSQPLTISRAPTAQPTTISKVQTTAVSQSQTASCISWKPPCLHPVPEPAYRPRAPSSNISTPRNPDGSSKRPSPVKTPLSSPALVATNVPAALVGTSPALVRVDNTNTKVGLEV
jgi:hypothetical protein